MPADRWEITKSYVRKRLLEDVRPGGKQKHGAQQRVATATGVSTAHVSNVINGRDFGDNFAHKLADFWWKIPYGELERLAMEDAGVMMLPSAAPLTPLGPVLRLHPQWEEMVAAAMRDAPTIEPQFFEAAGDAGLGPLGTPEVLAPVDIIAIARVLADQAGRSKPPKPTGTSGTRLRAVAASSIQRRRTK